VYPCRWSSRVFVDRSLLRTDEGQALALSWWGQDPAHPRRRTCRSHPSPPGRANDGSGLDAYEVGIRVPSGFDFVACDANQLVFWGGRWRRPAGPDRASCIACGSSCRRHHRRVDAATFPAPLRRPRGAAVIDPITRRRPAGHGPTRRDGWHSSDRQRQGRRGPGSGACRHPSSTGLPHHALSARLARPPSDGLTISHHHRHLGLVVFGSMATHQPLVEGGSQYYENSCR
jgi:hypothetical protein